MGWIVHYGIKGMRWGVRRSPEQLGRRRKVKYKLHGVPDEKAKDDADKKKEKRIKKIERKSKAQSAIFSESSSIIRSSKNLEQTLHESAAKRSAAKHVSEMSDEELRSYINRKNLEDQYIRMTSANVSKGRSYLRDTLDVAGSVTATTASVIAIVASIQKLKKM